MAERLRVAMVGNGFMGAAHSQGWRVAPRFFDLPLQPTMDVLVGRDPGRAGEAAAKWGWGEVSTDWREVVERDDIDVVDIVTPGDSHAEIAIAALEAGKHVLCEKPLANSTVEAEAMTRAAEAASARGIRSMLGFTYRRVPATALARQLIADGRIGEVRHLRASYLQDWLVDPAAPMTWRLEKDRAGSGALGDIGAHAVDLAQYMTGLRLSEVSGVLETFVRRRPLPSGSSSGAIAGSSSSEPATEFGEVTVDDLALFRGRFASGALGTFEASRMATGRKNSLRIEISGSLGSIAFDLENLNALEFYDATEPTVEQGFKTIIVTEPEHPWVDAWWPAGHMLGYEHGFANQAKDFVDAIAAGSPPRPSFADGLHVQRVLDAVEHSSATDGAWVGVADGSD
ncbi:putative dehydrogenase [Agromyces flavus]|uniref:Dehydrogenase n=1 Tax=Agromyces flavus TaxID=589382 RepID=A0A1H1X4V7_9MICO|nr:Gfo/Idh/MocA family oxidoreductase [Agromyces flavus]MCP2366330.1 putative dehydrogenase [Agromyces flavus]GGI44458.1 oxidoreductase [Agromyces flavus]SDT04101.1 Predicted dehydrogenase [Agromyces flavus]